MLFIEQFKRTGNDDLAGEIFWYLSFWIYLTGQIYIFLKLLNAHSIVKEHSKKRDAGSSAIQIWVTIGSWICCLSVKDWHLAVGKLNIMGQE